MGIFNSENAKARLESGFWDEITIIDGQFTTKIHGEFQTIDFFTLEEDDEHARCDFCKKKFLAGDMNGMEQHLKLKHPREINAWLELQT